MNRYRNELVSYLGIQKTICGSEETEQLKKLKREGQPLPQNISEGNSEVVEVFYKDIASELRTEDLEKVVHFIQAKYIRTIKKCIIFFAVLGVILLSLTLIANNSWLI